MKVLEIINSLSYRGGAQVLFNGLCREFAKNPNVELSILLLYGKIDGSFNELKKLPNVKFYCLNKITSIDLKASRKLKKIITSIDPDVINYHLPFLTTYFLAFGFYTGNWKLVKTFHSIPRKDTNHLELFFEKMFVKKKKLLFVGISDKITDIASKIYKKANIKTIFNGVMLKKNNSLSTKKYTFICIASFTAVKNHKLLFDAFFKHLLLHPNDTLVCVGDGELLDYYKNFIKNEGYDSKVFFTGAVDDVCSYLNESKIFVLSSTREGNPISILEAMSCGLPIIAPNIGGIPDVVRDNENGILFESNNVDELSNAMSKVMTKYKFYSTNNRTKSSNFNIKKTAIEYFDYFQDLKDGVIHE